MKKNKKTYTYIIVAVAVVLIIVGLVILLGKGDQKAKETNDSVTEGNHEDLTNKLDTISYNDKEVKVKVIEKEETEEIETEEVDDNGDRIMDEVKVNHKEVQADGKTILELNDGENIEKTYIINNWLVIIKKSSYITMAFYNFETKETTELSQFDYENMGIFSYIIGDSSIEVAVKRYTSDYSLLLEDDKKANICDKDDLKLNGVLDEDVVEAKYIIYLTNKEELDVSLKAGSQKTVSDIANSC